MREVFSRVLLRLLCNEERKFEVIYSERSVIELVDICEEADMLCGFFGKWVLCSWILSVLV
jgi:hypothetical protein